MKRYSSLLLICILFLPFVAHAAEKAIEVDRPTDVPAFVGNVPDEFIVVLKEDAMGMIDAGAAAVKRAFDGIPQLDRLARQFDVERVKKQFAGRDFDKAATSTERRMARHYKVKFAEGTLDEAMAAYAKSDLVDHVEPIGLYILYAAPNDPYYKDSPDPDFPHDQWHLWHNCGIHAEEAWDVETGDETVVIGILDSGVRYFHLDLGGNHSQWGPDNPYTDNNIWINDGETPGNGIDDDGNGYIDDVLGWDFVESTSDPYYQCIDQDCGTADNDPDDGQGHGTHVAGAAAAITNNNRQVAGVAGGWSDGTVNGAGNGVKIMPLRIGWRARLFIYEVGIVRMDYAAEAMNYVSDMVDRGVNVAAVNCSWGSSNSGGLGAAVDNLIAHDVMVVHAAGNDNSSSADYLGSRSDVMNVAATDSTCAGADFTNHGSWVDVAAPGVDILSTYRNPDDPDPAAHYIAVMSGTSMSAPLVAGIAGLLESCDPGLTMEDKFNLIVNNTNPYDDTRDLGSGIADAFKALDAAGCTGQECDVTADFTGSPTSGCEPLAVNFTDQSTGPVISHEWDFGDGGTSTEQSPSHTYTGKGCYTVTYIVCSDICCDTAQKVDYICVDAAPVADFSGSPTSGEAPLTVDFTDLSTNDPASWDWDFGDGATSTLQNPSHTYDTAGTYTVSLTSTNACGSDTETKVDYITVTCTAPTADFVGSPTTGTAPLTVDFTDQSTGNPTSWDWDFGDGGTSTQQNPSHTYNDPGDYTVTLTATNNCGSDVETKIDYIHVDTCYAPVADFSGTPTSGEAPLTVDFTDLSSNNPTSWDWDFGDGGTSTVQNPSHTYDTAGTYTVSLTATNSCGSDTETKVDYITVTCTPPVADFEGTPTSGEAPLTVDFTDLSSNNPTSWDWDFGDGGTSTVQNPSHTYDTAGTYTVSLTATNGCGSDTETKVDYITVTCTPPVADFVGVPDSGDAPLTVDFTDQSTNNPTAWDWDFGDGGTSTAQNPSHTYNDPGTYTVTLIASNNCGADTATKVDYITVTEAPQENVMFVENIVVDRQTYLTYARGRAVVTIYDVNNQPVPSATVYGVFSGPTNDKVNGTTNTSGQVTFYSSVVNNPSGEWCFEVTDVVKTDWTYDRELNKVTKACESGLAYGSKHDNCVPDGFALSTHPNPFNPATTIAFTLPHATHARLDIFNISGQRVAMLVDRHFQAGEYSFDWDGSDVASGIYLYRLTTDTFSRTKQMVLMK